VIARLTGAVLRGLLVVLLIATPSLILPTVPAETAQIVAFVAIAGLFLTMLEYGSSAPCLFEFRDAAPFNRIRFSAIMLLLVLVSLVVRHNLAPTGLSAFVWSVGHVVGNALDFPFSPMRLALPVLPETATFQAYDTLVSAFGLALLVLVIALCLFVVDLHRDNWPRRGTFNVWINLPTFDPTRCGDVVSRLDRDGRINIFAGIAMPAVLPMVFGPNSALISAVSLEQPQAMVWAVAVWLGLPFSLIMRGLAMQRIAQLIEVRRKDATNPRVGLVPL